MDKGKTQKIQPQLRFGIICNGKQLHTWEASCIKNLLKLKHGTPVLIIVQNKQGISRTINNKKKQIKFKELLWHIYNTLVVRRRTRVTQAEQISSILQEVPIISCTLHTEKDDSLHFTTSDFSKIQTYNLDFILNFGSKNIRGEILQAARYGVWTFYHSDWKKYRAGPSCFWEIYSDDPVTAASLQRQTDHPEKSIILKEGYFRTIATSYIRNRNSLFQKCINWPAQVCIDIQNGHTQYIFAQPIQTSAPGYVQPNNRQMLIFFIKKLRNSLRHAFDFFFIFRQWDIGVIDAPIHTFLSSASRPPATWFPAPTVDSFFADPFGIKKDNTVHILFEEYDLHATKAKISTTELNVESSFSPGADAIKASHHLSYPFLLEYNNKIYCIPESYQNHEVSLYEAKDFPSKWMKVATLIKDFSGADSTIFRYNGHWWLFATDLSEGAFHNLKAWYASDLFGPWMPHAQNPIKLDVRSSRPAGTPFEYKGELYRPAQNCAVTYGGEISLNRLIRLTPTEFEEEQIAVIMPDKDSPFPEGLHTISSVDNICLIDGMRKVFVGINLSLIKYKIRQCKKRLQMFF